MMKTNYENAVHDELTKIERLLAEALRRIANGKTRGACSADPYLSGWDVDGRFIQLGVSALTMTAPAAVERLAQGMPGVLATRYDRYLITGGPEIHVVSVQIDPEALGAES